MQKETVERLLNIYGKAWMTQDPELIGTIFTDDATYNDPHEPENIGKEAIRNYWRTKVVGEQANIQFKIANIWIDGETAIAEWEAQFTDTKRNIRIDMTEVAIMAIRENKIASLREYYKTKKMPL